MVGVVSLGTLGGGSVWFGWWDGGVGGGVVVVGMVGVVEEYCGVLQNWRGVKRGEYKRKGKA